MRDWRATLQEYVPRDWVFPIVLALFVAIVVWFGHNIHDFLLPPADTVTVPSFIGQTTNDANDEIQRLKLSSQVIAHTVSDRYPKGVVIVQRPEPGSEVREGRQVSFVISDGVEARLMPDLRYESLREVALNLARSKLQLGKTSYMKSDVVPDGHVIDQQPQPLSNVSEGDVVTLLVSRGGDSNQTIPNFVGMSIDDARALADKDGLKLGQIVWTPLGYGAPAHGTVVKQTLAVGTKVAAFTPVSLDVSAGPHESGYIVRQVHVLVSVPVPQNIAPGQSVRARMVMHDATGSYDLYNAYAQPGQKLDLTVTSIGSSFVDLYVNDVLVGETRLGNEPAAVYDEKPSPSPSPGAP